MKKRLLVSLVVTIAISIAGFFLAPGEMPARISLGIVVATFIPGAMAGWFFLTSLHAFKKDMKIAYTTLAAGIVAFGLSQAMLGFYFIGVLSIETLSLIVVTLYFLGLLTIYVGVWMFARLLKIHSRWGSLPLVSTLALGLALIINFLLFAPQPATTATIYLTFGAFIAGGGYGIAASVLAAKTRQKLGSIYQSATNWLIAGLWLATITSFHETTIRLVPFFSEPQFNPYFDYGLNLWPFLSAAVLFLGASLSFKELSRQFEVLPENPSYLDITLYAAQQVSTPASIDVILDQVRAITTTQAPGAKLSTANKARLLGVYKQIEDYLVTKEPLRKLSRDNLRLRLPDEFLRDLAATEKQELHS